MVPLIGKRIFLAYVYWAEVFKCFRMEVCRNVVMLSRQLDVYVVRVRGVVSTCSYEIGCVVAIACTKCTSCKKDMINPRLIVRMGDWDWVSVIGTRCVVVGRVCEL